MSTSCSRRVVLTRQFASRSHVITKCQTLEFPHNSSAPDATTGMNNMTKTCGNSTGVKRSQDNGTRQNNGQEQLDQERHLWKHGCTKQPGQRHKHNNVQEQPCRRPAPVKSVETQALKYRTLSPFPGNGPPLRGTPGKIKVFSLH